MAKRWSKAAKQTVVLDTIAAAIPILRLQNWQIEVSFEPDIEQRAGCYTMLQYKTIHISFDLARIRIFELIEFVVHELAHAKTWFVAQMLEDSAGDDPVAFKRAEDAYEELTTEIGHIALPLVLQILETQGKLPPEAKEQPTVIVGKVPRKRRIKETLDNIVKSD